MTSHPSGPPPELAGLPPSARIGKFLRTDLLGRGGCGDVYKAWDTELNRWVALKFIRSDDEAESARLRREAQTAARLNHPNICAVYEVAVHENRPFIAMQFIDGPTLAHGGDPRRIVRFIRDAALALHHAHLQGVIHRDLKPANLMVEEPIDESGRRATASSANQPAPRPARVYVMDFGLAKQMSVASSLSVSGLMVGTPAYMPPEQARGRTEAIDARSDVYSLGATLYELVTGRQPFLGDNAVDIGMQILESEPPPPRSILSSVDPDLETIILKCMEKEPVRRYTTAEELAGDLTRWLAGEPIRAHPPSTLYRFRKRLKKHRGIAAVAVLSVAAVALLLGLVLPRWAADRRARATAERKQALDQEVNRLWAEFLVVREWTRQPFRDPAAVRDARARAIGAIAGFSDAHPGLATAWYIRSRAMLLDGRLPEAYHAARSALKVDGSFAPARAIQAQIALESWRRRLRIGGIEAAGERAGNLVLQARNALRELPYASPDRFGLAATEDDAVARAIWNALVQSIVRDDAAGAIAGLEAAHRASPSEEYCRWIAQFSESADERRRWLDEAVRIAPHWLSGRLDRGSESYRSDRHAEAEADGTCAIELDPDHPFAFGLRAIARLALKRPADALADFNRALDLDPSDAAHLTGRGAVLKELGNLKAAEADHTRALEADPDFPQALANRGIVRAMLGDRGGARTDLDRAVLVAPTWHGGWASRGSSREMAGDRDGATEDYTRAIEINPRDAFSLLNRGVIYRHAGRWRDALADFDRGLLAAPGDLKLRANRALLKRESGDFQGSLEDYGRLIELAPGDPQAWTNRGKTKHAMGDLEGSIADHTKSTELRPGFAEGYYNRALARVASRDPQGALRDYGLAIEAKSDYVDAFTNRGLLLMNLGDSDGALSDQRRAVELKPEDPVCRVNLGVVLGNRGEKEAAIEQWQRALKLAPSGWPHRSRVEQMIRKAGG